MSRQTQKTTIDNIEFEYRHFSVKEALKMQVRLSKILAPAIEGLQGLNLNMESDINLGVIGKGLNNLIQNIDEEDLMFLIEKFSERCSYSKDNGQHRPEMRTVENNIYHWEICFEGQLETLYEWLIWCIKVEFTPFFKKLAEKFQAGKILQQKSSE